MMNICAGDYVTLKSVDEVKHLFEEWNPFFTPKNALGNVEVFVDTMVEAIRKTEVCKVERVDGDEFMTIIDGNSYWFNNKCIEDVYKLTKVS